MPYCNIYRVRKTLFGKSILQQYFDATALEPRVSNGWRDVSFKNAPAALTKATLVDKHIGDLLNIGAQTNE